MTQKTAAEKVRDWTDELASQREAVRPKVDEIISTINFYSDAQKEATHAFLLEAFARDWQTRKFDISSVSVAPTGRGQKRGQATLDFYIVAGSGEVCRTVIIRDFLVGPKGGLSTYRRGADRLWKRITGFTETLNASRKIL